MVGWLGGRGMMSVFVGLIFSIQKALQATGDSP